MPYVITLSKSLLEVMTFVFINRSVDNDEIKKQLAIAVLSADTFGLFHACGTRSAG